MDALYLSRGQTAGVAEATLRIADDERTVQTREDGVQNESVVPISLQGNKMPYHAKNHLSPLRLSRYIKCKAKIISRNTRSASSRGGSLLGILEPLMPCSP